MVGPTAVTALGLGVASSTQLILSAHGSLKLSSAERELCVSGAPGQATLRVGNAHKHSLVIAVNSPCLCCFAGTRDACENKVK